MNPIRVLQIIDLKRSNYFLETLADSCDRRLVEFTMVTLAREGAFARELRRRGITTYSLGCTRRSSYLRAIRLVAGIIRKHQVDIVHTHLVEPTWIGLIAARLTGRTAVTTRHHSDAIYRIKNPLKRWGYLVLERCCRAAAAHIIAPSIAVQQYLLEHESNHPAKVTLIPYGQNVHRFDAVTEEKVTRTRNELGMGQSLALACISRLVPLKGHIYLFEALAILRSEFPGLLLYLAGEGPYRQDLEAGARRIGVADAVRFLGWRDDALEIMAAADVVVHPSLTEALSSTLIEALILRKPIVASDVSGVRDTLEGYGTIVPPADSRALVEALQSVLRNLEAAKELAAHGRYHIFERMAAPKAGSAHIEVYRKVLAQRSGS